MFRPFYSFILVEIKFNVRVFTVPTGNRPTMQPGLHHGALVKVPPSKQYTVGNMKHILYVTLLSLHASIILYSSVEAKRINMCNIVQFQRFPLPRGSEWGIICTTKYRIVSRTLSFFTYSCLVSHKPGGQKSLKISSCM